MQAKFTDAGESKHEVFALTFYVSDSDDNEKVFSCKAITNISGLSWTFIWFEVQSRKVYLSN